MKACPKFERCSANICPLDPDWPLRTHGTGDRVCFYLLEAVKNGSEARFKAIPTEDMLQGVLGALPAICSRWASIRTTVERARTSGSRMDRSPPRRTA
jgi:hypothetical protein